MWAAANDELAARLRSAGLPAFSIVENLQTTVTLFLQASVAVFCENMNSALAGSNLLAGALAGAQKIQLWHGVSVKHLDLMLVPFFDVLDRGFRNAIKLATRTDYFLSTSSRLDAFWVRAFGCTHLLRAGHPRNAVLLRDPTPEELIGAELPTEALAAMQAPGLRRVLLAPTWQRRGPLFTSSPECHGRLAAWAEQANAVVFAKLHPFRSGEERPRDVPGRLYFLDAGVDVYPWLSRMDALVTDYSSIMFDFLFTGKPIFSFDTATEIDHGFEPDWSLIPDTPFRYVFDAGTLEAVLAENLDAHPLRDSQHRLRDELFETDQLRASAQLLQVVEQANALALDRPFEVIEPQ
jgi:CDP-glycerol glycerophosphotransferase (TagB/SpsB family)